MNNFNRRDFIKLMGITSAAVATPSLIKAAHGNSAHHVVVVGSGFAGSTVAKYLRLWSNFSIEVTVVDPKPAHVSCIMSNLVLNEQLQMSDITFQHALLSQRYGVNFIESTVTDIIDGSIVSLANGDTLNCDYTVIAPGISFDEIEGLDSNLIPHAWQAGPQTVLLRDQLKTMPVGGTFVMTVPKAPYRCPPGPYERACVVADLIKRKGGGKVIVLDLNPKITVEEHMFSNAFTQIYGDIIEYIPGVTIDRVDSDNRTIYTTDKTYEADVLNVIPTHSAGKIISDLGLNTVAGRWADVDPVSYEVNNHPKIHVIGDSGGTRQPKSGHMANSQAKVCADGLIRKFAKQSLNEPERLANITTNSACYSPITDKTATWLTAGFVLDPNETDNTRKMKAVAASLGEAELHHVDHYKDMFSWAENLFENTFM